MLPTKLVVSLLRAWPFEKGHLHLFDRLVTEKVKTDIDEYPQPVQMKTGIELFVRKNDHLSRWFRLFGSYEPITSQVIRKYAKEDEVFVDVGANLGLFAVGLAKDIGCPVVAYEPGPANADCLDQSIERNGVGDKVKVFRKAVSDETGSATLIEPEDHAGKSALEAPNPHFREGNRIDVEMITLDTCEEFKSYVESTGKKVGLIKMDIEGAEEKALRGMVNLLLRDRPAIIMEIFDGNLYGFLSSRQAVIGFLESLGYELIDEFNWNGLFVPTGKITYKEEEATQGEPAAATS